MSEQTAADVIVVGGGLAGSVAAVRAAELGLAVMLIEKGEGDRYPCNTRQSGGVFHIAMNEVKAPAERLRGVIETATGGLADAAQAATMAAGAGTLVDWLRAQGGLFIRGPAAWQSHILAPPRPIAAGVDWVGRGPDVLLRKLAERLAALGGKRLLGTSASELIVVGNQVAGVVARWGTETLRLPARAVVLADGGFQSNIEMVRKHIAPAPERLKQRGGATGMGAGIAMAAAVGADLVGMDRFYGHLLCRDAMTSDKVWPYPELDALATAGLVVDASGQRITDEGVGGVALANALARMPDPLAFTVVFDRKIWEGPGKSARIPANPTLEGAGATIHRASDVAALAASAGIDAGGLADTIAVYNAAVAAGSTAALMPARSAAIAPMAIGGGPFMAIPLAVGITYTMGGVRIDGRSRVLRSDGAAIAGLYAAGATTGGLEGGPRSTYLGGLVKAGTQALAAAADLAAALGKGGRTA